MSYLLTAVSHSLFGEEREPPLLDRRRKAKHFPNPQWESQVPQSWCNNTCNTRTISAPIQALLPPPQTVKHFSPSPKETESYEWGPTLQIYNHRRRRLSRTSLVVKYMLVFLCLALPLFWSLTFTSRPPSAHFHPQPNPSYKTPAWRQTFA